LAPFAITQSTATLVAAIIAAVASSLTTVLTVVPRYLAVRRRRKDLVELLSGGHEVRSLEWLGRRLGMSEAEVKGMLRDVKAHGVAMDGDKEGAALDSRHAGA
jgi:hypothetical protein